ncbi:restriction endonuclease [Salinimicrobium xinjiangense]|uniref:restriction endonuclease n=1 Tax=Salinimicrobium xinjiangense TaxID=438596 RepID=UPI000417026A|nr:restriction endonuclease [Salinimicrobium xinjiangense]
MKIITASGEKSIFSKEKVANSLRRSGAGEPVIQDILKTLGKELHENMTTKEIYKRAYKLLKSQDGLTASRYKLKRAIFELGPTGFPFEKFIGAIMKHMGYEVEVGKIVHGACVTHEIDVMAIKEGKKNLMECKFHSEQGRNCNVKIPLYIHSRFEDVKNYHRLNGGDDTTFHEGWVVTNTRFTEDALAYSRCMNLKLLSWDYPKGNSLKERIDHLGLYPITVSGLLSQREKQFLLSRDIVLCRELIDDNFLLDQLEISASRKKRILFEMRELCDPHKKSHE